MFELRPYQQECVDLVLEKHQENSRGEELLVLPTGAGKTVVFNEIIMQMAKKPLILAHRDDLLDQAADKYRSVRPDAIIGKVGGGIHEYGGEVTVGSVQTLSRPNHLRRLQEQDYDVLVVDEAHHAAADSYQRVINALPNAFKLYVTATPDRLDGKPIIAKDPLYARDIVWMIDNKYLSDVRAIAIKTGVSLEGVHTKMGDYSDKELDLVVNTPARNKRVIEAYLEHTPGRRAIAFCVTVDHAQAIADTANELGVPAAMICGDTPRDERKRLYQQLRDGEIKILASIMVLTEGFDEPLVDCIIMARPTQSRALYVQMGGRGLRLADGKNDCIILDLTDNCLKHRLQPQTLAKVLDKPLKDGQSVLEKKEEDEAAEREKKERKLRAARAQDVVVDIINPFKLEWMEYQDGWFLLSINDNSHRILLRPTEKDDGRYWVAAQINGTWQRWTSTPKLLDWAKDFAKDRARELIADPGKITLYDINAPWRKARLDATSKQADQLRRLGIEITPRMTKGEASDIISERMEDNKRLAQLARDLGVEVGRYPCSRCSCTLYYRSKSGLGMCPRCFPKQQWSENEELWQRLVMLPRKSQRFARESA